MLDGRAEEPYVTPAAGAAPGLAVVTPAGWDVLWRVWALLDVEAGEVWGRVNSSKRSASRGWSMWMCVAEESLLWLWLAVVHGCLEDRWELRWEGTILAGETICL
jgi:hypothetical protein